MSRIEIYGSYNMAKTKARCHGLCDPQNSAYDSRCPLHGAKTLLRSMKDTRGKRTSEGYKPEPNEKVEVRGD